MPASGYCECACTSPSNRCIQPGQWSFPLPLPLAPALGYIQKGSQLRELIPQQSSSAAAAYKTQPEWINDIDYEILGPLLF
jgi:hypothetical protein